MKRVWIVMAAICAALTFTACSRASDNQNTTSESPASTEESTAETEEESPVATTEAPGDTAEFKILTAQVTGISDTMDHMTVEKDGTSMEFDLTGVVVETSYSLDTEGVEVSIIYKGEISGQDTSNAQIVLVLDAQSNMEVQEVTGRVTDQAMSTFTIETDSGQALSFMKDNCEGLDTGVLGQAGDDSNGSGAAVKETYVTVSYDAGSQVHYPLKVEAAQ